MSAETDFRALLAGHAAVAALVGQRIAENAVPDGAVFPLVVFGASHAPEYGLDGTVLVDAVTFSVQCWAQGSATARAVADAVRAACAAAPAQRGCTVTSDVGGYEPDLQLDNVTLTVEWWV